MPSLIQIDDVRSGSTDLDELRPLLKRLLGKPFLFFRASYGDELTLHLGEPVPYDSPRMKGRSKGSFIVAARASSWVLEPGIPPGRLFTSDDILIPGPSSHARHLELAEIEVSPPIQPGSVVTTAVAAPSPGGILLSLSFSDGSSLLILPVQSSDSDHDGDDPISDWEIFMPRHRVLKAGPGLSWSYLDSHARPSEAVSA